MIDKYHLFEFITTFRGAIKDGFSNLFLIIFRGAIDIYHLKPNLAQKKGWND